MLKSNPGTTVGVYILDYNEGVNNTMHLDY